MAKSKVNSAEIASLLRPNAPGQGAGRPMGVADHGSGGMGGAGEHGDVSHPVRDRADAGVSRADNTLVLHPARITRRGTYVRPFTEDARFRELVAAIREAGNVIHVPVLVRVEGEPGAVEYVLVDGTHRLEAARRLGILVPAVNLGRIAPERALAIQAMANEVRAAMHVVDQATYVTALAAQGLSRDAIQRTAGFSAGRVSELLSVGGLLDALSEPERTRARQADRVTHRALRALKAAARTPEAFRAGVLALVEASESATADDAGTGDDGVSAPATLRERVVSEVRARKTASADDARADAATDATGNGSGVTFVPTKNARGTSVTFRIAWRARAVRNNPEGFLSEVHTILQAIAAEATAQYEAALNPMPVPASQRPPGEATPIDPRLLAGLSLPMLARRIAKRP